MRKLSQMMGALTSIEYLEKRYPSAAIRLYASVLTVFLLGFYVLAQLIAGGKGLAIVTGISYPMALAISVGIILIYTFMGGYLAVAYTDFFQSLVMLIGVLWILIAALSELGGLTAANDAINSIDPTLLSVWGKDLGFHGQWGVVAGLDWTYGLATRRDKTYGDGSTGDRKARWSLGNNLESVLRTSSVRGRHSCNRDSPGPC